jgi:pimeloyl-ACP methyl ester carboxylesterase
MRQLTTILIFLLACLSSVLVSSQTQKQTVNEAWVRGGDYRLKISTFKSEPLSKRPVLVLVIHGDAPFHPPDYQNAFAAKVASSNKDVVAIGLLRPGYTDPQGNKSDGERGEAVGDNYNAKNTDAIANAIEELKRRWDARRVVVAGHSGGAAIAANILGRHPSLVDAALLVSCPCDVDKWRENMFQLTKQSVFKGKIDTLSPIDQLKGVSKQVKVVMIVGSQDKVAPPTISESYRALADKLGKQVKLIQLEGKEHDIFLEDAVFAELALLLG